MCSCAADRSLGGGTSSGNISAAARRESRCQPTRALCQRVTSFREMIALHSKLWHDVHMFQVHALREQSPEVHGAYLMLAIVALPSPVDCSKRVSTTDGASDVFGGCGFI